MSNLTTAIDIAVEAHKGQKDKAGQPYIYHCYRVMSKVTTEEEKIVAILHDVLEDTNIAITYLNELGFSNNVLEALAIITKNKYEDYQDYISRVKLNKLARVVKVVDLLDNINLTRLNVITVKDINRTIKYLDALEYLISDS